MQAMQKVFHNILLPVHLNSKTDAAVDMAISFANRLGCNLHVLYIEKPRHFISRMFGFYSSRTIESGHKLKLMLVQHRFSSQMHPGHYMLVKYCKGGVQDQITQYTATHNIDLICLWNYAITSYSSINISELASATQCGVMKGPLQKDFWNAEKIVLPIGTSLPLTSMRVAISLAEKQGSVIHLVAMEKSAGSKSMSNLKKVYQLLKENTSLELVCYTLNGTDTGNPALEYARSIGGGLIVSNEKPAKGPWFSRWFFHHAAVQNSEIPVMVV
jgi:K+-sensing histidine kinase KdpD